MAASRPCTSTSGDRITGVSTQPPRRPSSRPRRSDHSGRVTGSGRGYSSRGDRDRYDEYAGYDEHSGHDDWDDQPASSRPLPHEVYMRRRIAALIIVLLLVALIVWGLTAVARSGSGEAEPATTAPATTLVTTPTEPAPDASASGTLESAAEETDSPASGADNPEDAALADKKNCELDDLRLAVATNKTGYGGNNADDKPEFTVQIKNPTGGDCVIDTSENQLRFEVYAIGREGFQPVWSDIDCYDPVLTGDQTFKAGEARNFSATWSRLGSAPGQCGDRQPVEPGAYVVTASLGDKTSESTTFNLG